MTCRRASSRAKPVLGRAVRLDELPVVVDAGTATVLADDAGLAEPGLTMELT